MTETPAPETLAPDELAEMPRTHVMDHRAKIVLSPYQIERLLQLPEDFRVTGVTASADPVGLEIRVCSYSLPHVVEDEDASPVLPLQQFVAEVAPQPSAGPVATPAKPRPVWGQVDPETGRSLT